MISQDPRTLGPVGPGARPGRTGTPPGVERAAELRAELQTPQAKTIVAKLLGDLEDSINNLSTTMTVDQLRATVATIEHARGFLQWAGITLDIGRAYADSLAKKVLRDGTL